MLTHTLTFSQDCGESFFRELPAAAAVFLLRGDGEPYVSKTANLRRRMQRLLGVPMEHSKRLNLRDRVRQIEFTPTGSDFESQLLLYKLLRETFPKAYSARLRLRPAPLVKLHLENEYPRASVTTMLGRMRFAAPESKPSGAEARFNSATLPARLEAVPFQNNSADDCGAGEDETSSLARSDTPLRAGSRGRPSPHVPTNFYYGPFPSRTAAEKFASDALDFFKMRRCVDDLHPDPAFPGCVYSEMKMCLAPCFKGCTDADYHAEVDRVQAFFESGGDSLARELGAQREQASAGLAFEEAAALHAKIEKLKSLLSHLPEIVRRIDRLDAVIIQPSAVPASVSFFRFSAGHMSGPVIFSVEPAPGSGSMESRVEEFIRGFSTAPMATVERMEHLAILKRWYYRSHRVGEIFFADDESGWPWRRMVRGIGRVYRGEKPQELAAATEPAVSPSKGTG